MCSECKNNRQIVNEIRCGTCRSFRARGTMRATCSYPAGSWGFCVRFPPSGRHTRETWISEHGYCDEWQEGQHRNKREVKMFESKYLEGSLEGAKAVSRHIWQMLEERGLTYGQKAPTSMGEVSPHHVLLYLQKVLDKYQVTAMVGESGSNRTSVPCIGPGRFNTNSESPEGTPAG